MHGAPLSVDVRDAALVAPGRPCHQRRAGGKVQAGRRLTDAALSHRRLALGPARRGGVDRLAAYPGNLWSSVDARLLYGVPQDLQLQRHLRLVLYRTLRGLEKIESHPMVGTIALGLAGRHAGAEGTSVSGGPRKAPGQTGLSVLTAPG